MRRLLFLATIVAVMNSAWGQNRDYRLNIGDFHEITIADNIPVVYKNSNDSAGYALYTCTPEKASNIAFTNDKAKLKIQFNQDSEITTMPVIELYSSTLTKVTNWGDSTVVVQQMTPVSEFKAKVIGNGDISIQNIVCTKVDVAVQAGSGHVFISGTAKKANLHLASAGSIEAGSLDADDVTCQVVGTGSIDCYAIQKLNVRGLGSGKVYYKGTPVSIKDKGVGIKLIKIEQ